MSVNKTAAGLTLAASLLIGAAAGAQEPGITDKAIKIGIFGPLSGPNMAYGFDVVNAAKMYYDKINKEGGIHGRKIEYVVEDDRCNANDLVAAVKKLVEQENVFMLNGGSCSAAVVAARRMFEQVDVLVDGPFVESRKSLELKWCGSSNQRLIDVPATRRAGSVVEWQPASFSLEKPSNW